VRTSGLVTDPACDEVPAAFADLAECPPVAALTTLSADGAPQTSPVWCDADGRDLRVTTLRGFAKARNMVRDPRVTLLCYDPRRPLRYLEVRGRVIEMTEAGAAAHLDALASKYVGRPLHYFGDVIPLRFAESEVPLLCRIRPTHVVAVDASAPANSAAPENESAPVPGSAPEAVQ
jgi:PPOX class probable F420-dependent enzyme